MLRLETEYSINVKYFYFLIPRAFIYVETRACTFILIEKHDVAMTYEMHTSRAFFIFL